VVLTDGERLTGMSEKPTHNFLVNAGIYALSPVATAWVPSGRPYDMTQLFETLLAEGGSLAAFPLQEY